MFGTYSANGRGHILYSDVAVNKIVPRLFFVEDFGDTRLSVKYRMREEKERFGEAL